MVGNASIRTIEEIFQDVNTLMLKLKYTFDFRQFWKYSLNLKCYLEQKMKPVKSIVVSKPILKSTSTKTNQITMETNLVMIINNHGDGTCIGG
jgi:hypothetical protein